MITGVAFTLFLFLLGQRLAVAGDHLAHLEADLRRQLFQIRCLGFVADGVLVVGDGDLLGHRGTRDDGLAPALTHMGHQGAVHDELADDLRVGMPLP